MTEIFMLYYFLGGIVVGMFIVLLAYMLTRKQEALNTMRSWGIDVNTALENGVKIERVH